MSAEPDPGQSPEADEQSVIERYFRPLAVRRDDVLLGIGDDAAVLQAAQGFDLVMTTDSLVEGVHFLPGSDPRSLGHRALAVNLSDLAAMGARPCWALLSLTLPEPDHAWLRGFSSGLGALLREHAVALVGGNLVRGPLNITLQLTGQVSAGRAVTRAAACAGDLVLVTGTVGDAAAGLDLRRGRLHAPRALHETLCQRFEFPTARLALGVRLPGLVSAAIDISDGLWRDLSRLAECSGCGAQIAADQLPVSSALRTVAGAATLRYALCGGEDYELLLTVPPSRLDALLEAAHETGTQCTVVGEVLADRRLHLSQDGVGITPPTATFDHFAATH